MEFAFLQIKFPGGHVLFINHFISFIFLTFFMFAEAWYLNKKMFDKALHAIISCSLTFVGFSVCTLIGIPWWISPIIVACIGVGKECYDKLFKKTHLFDKWDLLADAIGIIPITVFYVLSFLMYTEM